MYRCLTSVVSEYFNVRFFLRRETNYKKVEYF